MTIRNAISWHSPVLLAAFVAASLVLTGTLAADEAPDCSDELQQIPRDGSTIGVENLWLSYSGSIVYGGVAEPGEDDVNLRGPSDGFVIEELDAKSHTGLRLQAVSGDYEWQIGDAPEGRFSVSEPVVDDEAPTMGEGDVEADMTLLVYEEFPVMFRQWEMSFPVGTDEQTGPENLRYLLHFSWGDDGDETSETILVTPSADQAEQEQITVGLGGRTDLCNHSEPGVPLTAVTALEVRSVDLAGNISEEAATGTFEGVEAEKLAAAHEEFNEVIAAIDGHQPDAEGDDDSETLTSAEMAEQLEAEQDEEEQQGEEQEANGCTTVVGNSGGLAMVLMVLGLAALRRRA